jgi:DNA repair protein RecO (recombination protein O)
MRPSYATPAIVLRTRPFGESDKIVSFLTERFGKVTGIAKGALRSRKRFVNSLEPLAIINLRFQDRPHSNLAFILNAELILGYRKLATSLERICHAAYLVDITDGLVGEREESLAVYQHLRDSLRYLEQFGTSLRFLTAFELKLLRLVGYQPVLDNCMRCGRYRFEVADHRWYFSIFDGGIFCDSCADSRQEMLSLDAKAIELLHALLSEPGDLSLSLPLPLSLIKDMRAVMLRFIQFHMVREIRSASFLERFATANFGKI